jgi:hypothetical protein
MALGTGVDEVSTDEATALLALAQRLRSTNNAGSAVRLAALSTIADAIGWDALRKALDVPERTVFNWRQELAEGTYVPDADAIAAAQDEWDNLSPEQQESARAQHEYDAELARGDNPQA